MMHLCDKCDNVALGLWEKLEMCVRGRLMLRHSDDVTVCSRDKCVDVVM